MNIDLLDGIIKDYPSMNVCFHFSKKEQSIQVMIVQYSDEEGDEEGDVNRETYVVFPIKGCSSSFYLESDIPLHGTSGAEIGTVCIPSKSCLRLFSEFTNPMIICLIMDSLLLADEEAGSESILELIDFLLSSEYLISSSCVLIKNQFSDEYETNYKKSSAIWGGFTHDDLSTSHKVLIEGMCVIDGIEIPTDEHQNKLSESIFSSNGFDRFLKKYHLLELLYDYLSVAKLRTVGNGLLEYRNIMGEYSSNDIVNLKSMFSLYISDVNPLCDVIIESSDYRDVMNTIFQVHSKDSNPIKGEINWCKLWSAVDANKLSSANMQNKDYKFYTNNNISFDNHISNSCAYWIYRIRCSIAHNKIGEYIFSPEDEKFVVEFGERILDIVTAQIFSNVDLIEVLTKSKSIDDFLLANT